MNPDIKCSIDGRNRRYRNFFTDVIPMVYCQIRPVRVKIPRNYRVFQPGSEKIRALFHYWVKFPAYFPGAFSSLCRAGQKLQMEKNTSFSRSRMRQ